MRKGVCKYFNGFWGPGLSHDKECEAGVNYREMVGGEDTGWVKRAPCFDNHKTEIICFKREYPTAEEIRQHEAEQEAWANRMAVIINMIPGLKSKHPEGGNGTCECPLCKGEISYSVSGLNHHVHLMCSTEGCVQVME